MKRLYPLIFSFLCFVSQAFAQKPVSQYRFEAFPGPFTPIAGGTTVNLQGDDVLVTGLPIGFPFVLSGVNYTTFAVSSNGWLSLGNPTGGALTQNTALDMAGITPVMMLLWDDLHGAAGTSQYMVTGGAGNRVFTFEWLNWRWDYISSAPSISFQVKLFERGGAIQFIYRQETAAPAFTSFAPGATIGVANSSTDYQILQNSSANPLPSTSVFTDNILTRPATGQIYQWRDQYQPTVMGGGSYCSDTGLITLKLNTSDITDPFTCYWTGPNGFTSTDTVITFPKIPGPGGPSGAYNVTLYFTPATGLPDTSATETTVIYVQQVPNPPQAPYLTTYCLGSTPDTIPVYGQDIRWYSVPQGGTPITSQPVINTSVPGSFTYYLSQTVGNCESGRTAVTVQVVPPAPPPTVTSPIAYCQNDIPLPLEAVGQNLLWYTSDTGGVGTPIVPTPSTGAQDTMTWYVTQTIDGCESVRVPIEVHINYRPNALVLASRDYVCAGDTLVISYYGNADGDLGVTFNWTFPSTATVLSGTGQGPYIVRFDQAGNQRITLIADNEGCASPQAHYDVEVRAIPEFTLNIQESACQGDLVNLAINQITPAIDVFVWDIAGGEKVYASETAGPYGVKWNTPGSKTITVVATDNACVSPAIQDEIFIRPLPDARITILGDKVCAGDSIQLEGLYSPDYSYQWLPEQFFPESNSYRQWARIDYAREITLNVTDIYNCKSTNSIFIQPENCCTVSFPTAFTPNEDTRNDVFRPITQGNQKITKFVVKNRWGQQVFESADDRRGWDGKLGGIPQDMGAYFYYIKYQCSDGKFYEDRGEVMLVR